LELVQGPDGSPQVAAEPLPGIGAEPDEALLRAFCVAKARFE
jgi:hypothetical protein